MTTTPNVPPAQPSPTAPAPARRTWMPTTTGILSIISGVLGLLYGLVLILLFSMLAPMMGLYGASAAEARVVMTVMQAFGIPLVILGIVAIVGGVYAIRRRIWGLALAGAICAIFSVFGILGILSVIFVSLSKKEFT